jgi:hypothetical protein
MDDQDYEVPFKVTGTIDKLTLSFEIATPATLILEGIARDPAEVLTPGDDASRLAGTSGALFANRLRL